MSLFSIFQIFLILPKCTPADPLFTQIKPGKPDDETLFVCPLNPVVFSYQFGDLDGVEGRALPELITDDEE